jgi:hypothetical protein
MLGESRSFKKHKFQNLFYIMLDGFGPGSRKEKVVNTLW